MKDKLEKNMYVRTKWGIAKIREISEEIIYVDTCFQPIDETKCYKEDIIGEPSFNPIDLIEEGDYVNGFRVVWVNLNNKTIGINSYYLDDVLIKNKQDIKSIVTKEMYSSVEYRVETN